MDGAAYLVSLDLSSTNVLVVGGGKVAARKIKGLPADLLSLKVVAPEVISDITAFLSEASWDFTLFHRRFDAQDLNCCDLVFAATSDTAVNLEVSRLAMERGILVNNVSDSAASTFSNLAVVNKGGLSVGVSSNPKVPGFSMAIGKLIEEMLPADIDRLLVLAAEVRSKALSSGHSPDGLDWLKVFNSRVFEYIRQGEWSQAEESLDECHL
ncbi:MAG: bifunctional precorrin-2 dehydrogenase/sirohydrochlorin ferrochelatase [Actinomycetota bacterium]|nr:bifunctional precorrin-2 dehydrogenase/sirohydrochlorin ferrochelatase [Actinomycetota bacterium]